MDFWRSALQVAEKAAVAAKDFGKKGLEVVEATAEEANKKLNLNLHDKVGAGPPKDAPLSPEELAAFGITPDFEEFVRTLNYSVFRDFPPEHLLPASSSSSSGGGTDGAASSSGGAASGAAYQLNPWQIRHATLVVQALKEVNELRFVLCPKYMTDEHFWHVYYTLARKSLPDKAFSWDSSDELPKFGGEAAHEDAFSLTGLGNQLMQLGSKLQSAASGRPQGLELTSFTSGFGGGGATSSGTQHAPLDGSAGVGGAAAAGAAAARASAGPASGMLAEDPDLEAYLQVAINNSQSGSQGGEEDDSGYAVGEDDLDLDSYINELSAEVEAAAAAEESSAAELEAAAGSGEGDGSSAEKN